MDRARYLTGQEEELLSLVDYYGAAEPLFRRTASQ